MILSLSSLSLFLFLFLSSVFVNANHVKSSNADWQVLLLFQKKKKHQKSLILFIFFRMQQQFSFLKDRTLFQMVRSVAFCFFLPMIIANAQIFLDFAGVARLRDIFFDASVWTETAYLGGATWRSFASLVAKQRPFWRDWRLGTHRTVIGCAPCSFVLLATASLTYARTAAALHCV